MSLDLPSERAVVLFSGGFDSTLVLADLVSSVSDTDVIYAVSIQHNLTGMQKLRREYESQLLILRELRKRFPKVKIEHEVITVESNWISGDTSSSTGLAQPILWLCNLIPLLQKGDVVYVGYNKDDQAIVQLDNITNLLKAACAIQENKKLSVEYPLKYASKIDVLRRMVSDYPYLLDLCTSCESMIYAGEAVCGECVPCRHLKEALMLISLDSDKHAEVAKEMLLNRFGLKVSVTNVKEETKVSDDSIEVIPEILDAGGDEDEVKSSVS